MKKDWYKNCRSEEDKQRVKRSVFESKPVLDQLSEILQDKLEQKVRDAASGANFSEPGWEGKIAHSLGEQAALRIVLNLLDIEDK